MTIVRTYERFSIVWYEHGERVSTWSSYDSRDEADAIVARADRTGVVVRDTFEVVLDECLLDRGIYQPGYADRTVA